MYPLGVGALLCCVVLSAADISNINDCTYKADDGSAFDLSPLIKGGEGYTWNQTVYDVEGDAFINTKFSGQAKFGFQMDMCRNVSKVAYPNACKTVAPAYMFTFDSSNSVKSCSALGDWRLGIFNQVPSKTGLYLAYFMGSSVDGGDDNRYAVRIYCICEQSTTITVTLEHIKTFNEVHIRVMTKYACA